MYGTDVDAEPSSLGRLYVQPDCFEKNNRAAVFFGCMFEVGLRWPLYRHRCLNLFPDYDVAIVSHHERASATRSRGLLNEGTKARSFQPLNRGVGELRPSFVGAFLIAI